MCSVLHKLIPVIANKQSNDQYTEHGRDHDLKHMKAKSMNLVFKTMVKTVPPRLDFTTHNPRIYVLNTR